MDRYTALLPIALAVSGTATAKPYSLPRRASTSIRTRSACPFTSEKNAASAVVDSHYFDGSTPIPLPSEGFIANTSEAPNSGGEAQ